MRKVKVILEFEVDSSVDPDDLLDWTQFALENADYAELPDGVIDNISAVEYIVDEEEDENINIDEVIDEFDD